MGRSVNAWIPAPPIGYGASPPIRRVWGKLGRKDKAGYCRDAGIGGDPRFREDRWGLSLQR